jgi:hypothetical protein
MAKSIDLGRSYKDELNKVSSPDEPHYPDLYIDSDDARLADLPDKGECTIKYRVCSRTHREEGKNGDKKHSCSLRLEILSIEAPEKAKKKKNGYGDDVRKNFSEFFKDK